MTALFVRKPTKRRFKVFVFFVVGLTIPVLLFVKFTKAAGDTSQTWNFANSGDYTVGDSNSIEVASNTARLKVQNYSSDANTAALYHFDESNGSSATDSSSNSNTATVTGGTFNTGNLNNALYLTGNQSYSSVPDSASLSLSQSNTIEAWVKFNNAFSAYSTHQRQGIVDKGVYRLYYDNETGQIVYQLAPNNQTSWAHAAGPVTSNTPGSEATNADGSGNGTWDFNGKAAVTSAVHVGSDLYVGLGDEWADAEVWKWNGTTWSQVGGDGRYGSWDNDKYEIVSAMTKNGTTIYVGLGNTTLGNDGDAEVWAYNTTNSTWTKVGGDGVNGSWVFGTNQGPFEIVNALYYVGGALYAGLGNTFGGSNSDAEVWRWTGSGNWVKVGGDSGQGGYGWTPATGYENVFSLASDGTNLYAGLGSSAGDGDVWVATLASLAGTPSWTQIGGDALNSSWAAATYEVVQSMYVMGSYVYAGLGNSAAGDAEVWRYPTAGGSWAKVGECASTSACTANGWANNVYEQVWNIWSDGTTLYVGLGSSGGDNDVWTYNGVDTWAQIAGNGGANDILNNHTNTRVLYHDGTNLYVGLQHSGRTFTGEVWRYGGTAYNWTRIGGNNINNSWGFYPISTVEKIVSVNGKMYAGLGNTASGVHGAATVWQFDGSTWSIIGGQGLNSGWGIGNTLNPGPYERITSMIGYNGHLYVGLGSTAGDAEVWGWETVASNTWTKVGGDGGFAVAVSTDGSSNRVMTSPDSTTWTIRTSAADLTWNSVVHANNIFVAVASSGTGNRVMTSSDGLTWTPRTSAADNNWNSVTFGNGLFVAVASSGSGNRVMTSPNGIDWTTRTSAADNAWKSVTFGNGMFVAVANTGSGNRVMTSTDGINWATQTSASDNDWSSVTYGNGTFVAVATTGTNTRVMTSTNGVTWNTRTSAADNNWTSVTFGNNLFVAVANTGTTNRVMTSPDGTTWTIRTAATNNNWTSVTWSANLYTAVASGAGSGNRVMTSPDGTTWTTRASAANNSWNAVGNSSSWTTAIGNETVETMTVHECPGVTSMCLYVGLGNTGSDGKVWAFNGASWIQIGGNGTNNNWGAGSIETVNTLVSFNGKLYAGLGSTISGNDGDAELWEYAGTGSTWTKVAGDGVNSSWNYNASPAQGPYENVFRAMEYNSQLYVALGSTADGATNADSEVWSWGGSGSWTKVGGDGVNSSWNNSYNFESVRSLEVYNGDLYAGLGDTAAAGLVDSQVWKYNGSSWSVIGGDNSNNSSWPDNISSPNVLKEQILTMDQFNGKLYAGLGNSVGDAAIWAYGGNKVLRSAATSQDTNWHHIAATYDGTNMKIYIDGVENASSNVGTITIADNANSLLIGSTYGAYEQGRGQGFLDGKIDELRISNTARSSFNATPYVSTVQTVGNTTARWTNLDGGGVGSYAGFVTNETLNGGTIRYRLSTDNGATWIYWNTSAWVTSSSTSQVNTPSDINLHISDVPITENGIKWQAILQGNGNQRVTLNSVTVEANLDNVDPSPPNALTALDSSGGLVNITSNIWYTYPAPYFSWSGALDTGGAGIAGYYVYFGTSSSAVPETTNGTYQTASSFTASNLVNGTTYYLRIQTKDKAQNASTIYPAFIYKYDTGLPATPSSITVSPDGYSSTNSYTFEWPASGSGSGSDGESGIYGYQYKTSSLVAPYNDWSATITDTTVTIDDAAVPGQNTFYLRAVDNAGNIGSTEQTKTFLYSGAGPSKPKFLTITPETNTMNSFAVSWQPPDTYNGPSSELTYCYTVNVEPNGTNCTWTSAGATSLSADSFATKTDQNKFYLTTKNSPNYGGSVGYDLNTNVATANFFADTDAPGIPLNVEIADVSVKSTSSWKLAISWEPPADGGPVAEYEIFRSLDNSTFTKNASTTGIAFVDTGLDQETYYYEIRACDSVANCGAFSTVVSMLPTGKFTDAAALTTEPTVTSITTKQAVISWGTSRTSDSKIAYGTSSGDYLSEEPSNSTQVTDHEISLTNLKPGTKYYFVAKWTDEDGNTGTSDETNFSTAPAPTIKDPKVSTQGITSVSIQYTVKNANKVKIYFGETSAFGGTVELSTSTSETTYTTTLDSLKDGTKYYYKINTLDSEGDEYDGSILTFETLPRPRIDKVAIQQVKGSAQPAALISWYTNTEVSSIVTYYPEGNAAAAKDEVNVNLVSGEHRIILKALLPQTKYVLYVKGLDRAGNEATSDAQIITTSTDTRPPLISNLNTEGGIEKISGDKGTLAQIIVSWDTDEQSTSQVEFGEGTGVTYSQKTQEDSSLTYNHLVVLSGLTPSKVYHLRALSKDKAGNEIKSIDTVTITPKATDNAFDLVITNLKGAFGFLGGK